MTQPDDKPTLDDVMESTEETHPDRRQHAKTPKHVSSEELDERTRHEAEEVGAEDRG